MAKLQTISKRTVDGLSAGDKDAAFRNRELPGFGVRPSGAKVYVAQRGRKIRADWPPRGYLVRPGARRRSPLPAGGEAPEPAPADKVTVTALAER